MAQVRLCSSSEEIHHSMVSLDSSAHTLGLPTCNDLHIRALADAVVSVETGLVESETWEMESQGLTRRIQETRAF